MQTRGKVSEVKVFRYDPDSGGESRYDAFSVPYEEGNTVMDVLNYIYENLDQGVAYRSGCGGAGHQRCGACPVVVNGKPVYSCKSLAKEEMIIDPHPRFEVIRDLAVDFDKTREITEKKALTVRITVDPEKCDGCRDCVILCPMNVYELKKEGKRAISHPSHIENCCGESCNQCAIFCKNSAISVEDI